MKYFIVLSCVAVVAYGLSAEMQEKLKAKIVAKAGECKTEVKTSDDDVAPVKVHQPPTTQKGKCFIACIQKKFGFLDASGKIDKAGSAALIEKMKPLDEELYGKMKKVLETCLGQVTDAAEECETAFNMYTCVLKEDAVVGIKPIDF